jgi:hypothetical protein
MIIKGSPWNPWNVARLNMALQKYMETIMYRERVKAYGDEWAIRAFEEYGEIPFFVRKFTFRDRLRVIFTPFSCGDYYMIPWYLIEMWLCGVKIKED